ncbi:hypothetical protein ABPG77_011112 [Micractinium sp. CCAP 211/92]
MSWLKQRAGCQLEQSIAGPCTSIYLQAVEKALEGSSKNSGITANVNTMMAVTGVIAYWRGVDGLLGILLEDSLEGYVACTVFGFAIGTLIRTLKLPVVEGGGMGPF